MITEEGDKGIRELKSRFPEFNLGVRESSVNCHPRQKEVSRDNAGLLSTQTLQLTLSGNEHRKLFKTQRRSQPRSGEEQPRKSLARPMLLPNCPLYLYVLPSGSPQILLQNGNGKGLLTQLPILISQTSDHFLPLEFKYTGKNKPALLPYTSQKHFM